VRVLAHGSGSGGSGGGAGALNDDNGALALALVEVQVYVLGPQVCSLERVEQRGAGDVAVGGDLDQDLLVHAASVARLAPRACHDADDGLTANTDADKSL
jgi:hypothetical protein